jgi:hypothetical protein
MKTRYGFISNSSSTSFCIFGTIINEEIKEKTFLDVFYGDPNMDGVTYIGLEYSNIQDTETGQQFKERIEQEVHRLLGPEQECGTYEESYYNG